MALKKPAPKRAKSTQRASDAKTTAAKRGRPAAKRGGAIAKRAGKKAA